MAIGFRSVPVLFCPGWAYLLSRNPEKTKPLPDKKSGQGQGYYT